MEDVIPGILAHRYHTRVPDAEGNCPSNLPIPLKWNISHDSSPIQALDRLRKSIDTLAVKLGIKLEEFHLRNPDKFELCLADMQDMFSEFVSKAANRNIFIWMYVDEIQVLYFIARNFLHDL
jgi:hypothetical protein